MLDLSLFEEKPRGNETVQQVSGLWLPLMLGGYGLLCILHRAGAFPGRYGAVPFHGFDAIILGIAYLSCASLLHFHFYWGLSDNKKLKARYQTGRTASILALISSLGWVAWYMVRGIVFG